MGKGSNRRPENSKKVRENWDAISWKSGENGGILRVNRFFSQVEFDKETAELSAWLDDNDIMND